MSSDPFAQYKATQREGWALFAPLEVMTIQPAGLLVEFAGVKKGTRVLDVGCGTGVVAVTAAKLGAEVDGLDLSPALLERAQQNGSIAQQKINFREGDVEQLPYKDGEFDFVLSQFGHMFAPRPEIALSEMLRVLKPGGTIAFSTWPPELFTGKMFALVSKHLPPPEGVAPPPLWGDPAVIRERLGEKVKDLQFDRALITSPALSLHHVVHHYESNAAPVIKLKEKLQNEDPAALERFRAEFRELISKFVKLNTLHQHFLLTRAVKC
jgi:SAM-dependent methyltransferase